MKKIKYRMLQPTTIDGVELPLSEEYMASAIIPWSVENEERAKREAYNGEYEIYDDVEPDPSEQPTELDRLDARLTYVEMMAGLLEV